MDGTSSRITARPNIDVNVIHRDLAGYYRAYGMFDSSTADGLFDRVVWCNVSPPHLCRRASPPLLVAAPHPSPAPHPDRDDAKS